MRALFSLSLLCVGSLAFAGADGDGFTVLDGDCDDYDPNTYPGAPELCDGKDNSCDPPSVLATSVLTLGNGNDGEGICWRPDDGLWYHVSGITDGQEYFEPVDLNTLTVLPNLLPGNTFGPDPASEPFGVVWFPPLNVFVYTDIGSNMFHVDSYGMFTYVGNLGTDVRGLAVVGNEVYGVSRSQGELFRIDPVTATILESLPVTIDGQPGAGCHALTHDPSTGDIWGICNPPGFYYYGTRILVSIDVSTGEAINMGDTGQKLSGMGIDDLGNMYAVSGDGNYYGLAETVYHLALIGNGRAEAGEFDVDGDGYLECEECDDNIAESYPGAPEVCDGYDNDCDGVIPADEEDLDNDGAMVCGGDCDDNEAMSTPGREEVCDGVDSDCDGSMLPDEMDADGDGHFTCDDDCDDNNADVYAGADEICDLVDNNCDGIILPEEVDVDGDGTPLCRDCNDNDPNTFPGAEELCDGIDNVCSGSLPDDEADNDGDGVALCAGDCDDADPLITLECPEVDKEPKDEGCGCTTAPSGALGLWLLPLALIRRRP